MEGVIAGAPATCPTGGPASTARPRPIWSTSRPSRSTTRASARRTSSTRRPPCAWWMASKYVFDGGLNGRRTKFGELSADSLLKWIYEYGKNFDAGIGEPIRGFTPDLQAGQRPTTWWGLWKWDEKAQKLTNNPVVADARLQLLLGRPLLHDQGRRRGRQGWQHRRGQGVGPKRFRLWLGEHDHDRGAGLPGGRASARRGPSHRGRPSSPWPSTTSTASSSPSTTPAPTRSSR